MGMGGERLWRKDVSSWTSLDHQSLTMSPDLGNIIIILYLNVAKSRL